MIRRTSATTMKIINGTLRASQLNLMIASPRMLREAPIIPKRGYFITVRNLSGSRGFSLMELIVFMVAASIIIVGILYPFVIGVRDFEKPDEMLRAIHLAQTVMEKYSHVAFSHSFLNITSSSGTAITDIIFPDDYSGTKSIQYIDPTNLNLNVSGGESPFKKIDIVITTPSSRTVSLQGIVSKWSYEELMSYQ